MPVKLRLNNMLLLGNIPRVSVQIHVNITVRECLTIPDRIKEAVIGKHIQQPFSLRWYVLVVFVDQVQGIPYVFQTGFCLRVRAGVIRWLP